MAAVQAASLLDIATIADTPGELPNIHPELSTEPHRIIFYILAVPGTQDVILTTLRPSEKATAVDISQSFYYLYYADPNNPTKRDLEPTEGPHSIQSSSPSTIAEELDDQLSEEISRWKFPASEVADQHTEAQRELSEPVLRPRDPLLEPDPDSPASIHHTHSNEDGLPIPPPKVVELPPPTIQREYQNNASIPQILPQYNRSALPSQQGLQTPPISIPQPPTEDVAPPIPQRHTIRRKPVGSALPATVKQAPNTDTAGLRIDSAVSESRPGHLGDHLAGHPQESRFSEQFSPEPKSEASPFSQFPPPPTGYNRFEASPARSDPSPTRSGDRSLNEPAYGTPSRSNLHTAYHPSQGLAPPTPQSSVTTATPEEKRPMGPRPLQIRKNSLNSPKTENLRPYGSYSPPKQQQQGWTPPSYQRNSAPKREITLIRRDPFSGAQSNIGSIKLHENEISFHKHKNSSFAVDISTSGYRKYIRSLSPFDSAGHHSSFECHVDYNSGDDDILPKLSSFSHRKFGSISEVSKPVAAIFASDHGRHKGYSFSAPWGSNCELSTGKTGRSMKCKVERPRSHHQQHYDYDEDYTPQITVSELRFNLPLLHLASSTNMRSAAGFISPPTSPIKSSAASFFSAAKEKASFLRRSRASPRHSQDHTSHHQPDHGRSKSASEMWFSSMLGNSGQVSEVPEETARPDRYQPATAAYASRTPSPPKYSSYFATTKEEKDSLNSGGGGLRGKDVKLGKLIVEAEGLKMLDLVVAVNMGIWWQAWERSMKS